MTTSELTEVRPGHGSANIVSAIRLLQSCHYVVLPPPEMHAPLACRLRLEYDLRLLRFEEAQIRLSPCHVRIIQLLLEAGGRWCSRDELCVAIWGDTVYRGNALSVNMFHVRQRLRRLTSLSWPIIASRHAGFRLAPELFL
jgi:DNA-binding response OmpR family regulator